MLEILLESAGPKGPSFAAGYGLVAGGYLGSGSSATRTTEKYGFAEHTWAGSTLLNAAAHWGMGSMGSATRAYFAGGTNNFTGTYLSTMDTFDYATDITAAGLSLAGAARGYLAGASNATLGIIGGGQDGTGVLVSTNLYNFSANTRGNSTVLTVARRGLSASSNATQAIFQGGMNAGAVANATTERYTYSGATLVATTNLSPVRGWGAATGTTTQAFNGGGNAGTNNNLVGIFGYADSVRTAGTNLGLGRGELHATGNPTTGLWTGGFISGGAQTYTDNYTYASNTVTVGATLAVARSDHGSASSSPGGF